MSWKPEVKVSRDPKWYDNALRFATKEEAEASARDLYSRWTQAEDVRAVESEDPVNYRWTESGLELIPELKELLP